MREILLSLVVVGSMVGCGCGETGLRGHADAADDLPREPSPDLVPDPAPDPVVEPISDPVADPECWDHDDDSYQDEACGGLDCDDLDPSIHPGALDICDDGIDQDCDGLDATEGLRGEPVIISSFENPEGTTGADCRVETELAWTGSEYAIFWRNYMTDGTYLDRVDAMGKSVSDEVFLREYHWEFRAAWSGSMFGTAWIIWEDTRARLFYQALAPDGAAITGDVLVAEMGEDAADLVMLPVRDGFVLQWTEWGAHPPYIAMTRINDRGTMMGGIEEISLPTTVSGYQKVASWSGSDLGVVWISDYGGSTSPSTWMSYRLVDDAGHELTEVASVDDDADYVHDLSRMLWTGSAFGVFHTDSGPHDGHTIEYKHITRDAVLLDDTTVMMTPDYYSNDPAAAWTGLEYGLFWTENDEYFVYSQYLQRVAPDGVLFASPITIRSRGRLPEGHEIIWTGHEYGLCWTERYRDESVNHIQLYFARAGFCE